MDFYSCAAAGGMPEGVKKNELLSKHTTFRIGGPADYFVVPKSIEELRKILQAAEECSIPVYFLGNGSNILFGDKGYRGMIIQMGKGMDFICWENENTVKAGAGVMLSRLAQSVAERGLAGFEFAGGIPGSLGGAVTMNAGAYNGEIKDCIQSVKVCDKKGTILTVLKDQMELGYRESIIQRKNYIVLEAVFLFEKGDKNGIQEKMREYNRRRKMKQPLEYPSAGSTFKRPKGNYAGKLIEEAGLKGYRIGDAMVSEKHSGFVVNAGNATAKEVIELIEYIRKVVRERFDIELEPEIRFVGEF